MPNRFIDKPPTSKDIQTMAKRFVSIHNSKIIKCDVNDIMFIMKEANNIVMTKSVGSGQGRFRNAINDAVLRCQVIAKDYNPFSAEKVLLVIGYNSRRPFSMEEFIEISTFTDMFDNKIIPVIGMYINDRNIDQDSIIINGIIHFNLASLYITKIRKMYGK